MLSTQGEIKQKVSVKKRRKKGLSLSLAWLLYSSSLACAFIMRTNVCVRSYSFAAVAYPVSTSSLAFLFSVFADEKPQPCRKEPNAPSGPSRQRAGEELSGGKKESRRKQTIYCDKSRPVGLSATTEARWHTFIHTYKHAHPFTY